MPQGILRGWVRVTQLELIEKPETPESFTENINHYGAAIPREGEVLSWDSDHYRVVDVQHRLQLGTVVIHLRSIDATEVGADV